MDAKRVKDSQRPNLKGATNDWYDGAPQMEAYFKETKEGTNVRG